MLLSFLFLVSFLSLAYANLANADLGAENVLVVVNPESEDSRTIAEAYVKLQEIPQGNVVEIAWDVSKETTDIDTFREKILTPILAAIEERGLQPQIHCVAYSAGFPWRINAASDVKSAPKDIQSRLRSKMFQPSCSLNALTFHHQAVMAKKPLEYLNLRGNRYALASSSAKGAAESFAFDSSRRFGSTGEVVEEDGAQYLLCVALAITSGRGTTAAEAVEYLTAAAKIDGTKPKGTIYYCENSNVRSRTRQRHFPAAVDELKKLGVNAEIIQGVLPEKKSDVQGAMIGAASFQWEKSGSEILPGAICEHLTSFGGVMSKPFGQTPLSELLRHGAAGSCGTVTEPFAVAAKFPTAFIHVHYARGCTLAEAFYQTVTGPYHLLIVGDPLCRPWARIPKVTLEPAPPAKISGGKLLLKPSATVPDGGKIAHFELYINGVLKERATPKTPLELDTDSLGDGVNEIRIVAVSEGNVANRGRVILKVLKETLKESPDQ